MTVAWSPLDVGVATRSQRSGPEHAADASPIADSFALPRLETALRGSTIFASLCARTIFFSRELRHCVRGHDPEHPFRVLQLGGDGRELAEFLLEARGYAWVDAALVSADVCPLGCAAQYVFRIEEGMRFTLDSRGPLAMLNASDRAPRHDRDLVCAPTLLDFVGDADVSSVLDRVLEHLRPGGILVAATFDDGIPAAEIDRLAALVGTRPHARSARQLEMLWKRSTLACNESVRVLDRGPNRYLFLRRRLES